MQPEADTKRRAQPTILSGSDSSHSAFLRLDTNCVQPKTHSAAGGLCKFRSFATASEPEASLLTCLSHDVCFSISTGGKKKAVSHVICLNKAKLKGDISSHLSQKIWLVCSRYQLIDEPELLPHARYEEHKKICF